MYKMVICLDEKKINNEGKFDLNAIYEKLDIIFSKRGFKVSINSSCRTYSGTGADTDKSFEEIVRENFRLTPDGIIETLGLRDTGYKQTAKYGHFGIEGLPWEKTDKAEDLKKYIK